MSFGFVLAACGNSNSSAETSSAADETVSEEPAEEQETTDTNGENVLIAYFSYTGNTEEVAQMIAEYTGGDLAEIQRAEEYGDLQEEAETEILDGVHPEITVSVDNVEEYDTIFVGYPIWLAYHKLIQCTLWAFEGAFLTITHTQKTIGCICLGFMVFYGKTQR